MADIDIDALRETYRKHHWRWFEPEAMWRDVVTLLDALAEARAERDVYLRLANIAAVSRDEARAEVERARIALALQAEEVEAGSQDMIAAERALADERRQRAEVTEWLSVTRPERDAARTERDDLKRRLIYPDDALVEAVADDLRPMLPGNFPPRLPEPYDVPKGLARAAIAALAREVTTR